MKHKLFVLILLAIVSAVAPARTPIRQWFAAMPDSVMPLLTKNNRLDFMDFIDCQMAAVVTNRLEGKSEMKALTDDYLCLEYTKSSHVEMKLLPVTDTTDVLCLVTTLKAAVEDSHVMFFGEGWVPLPVSTYLQGPQIRDFGTAEPSDSVLQAYKKVDVCFKVYALSADEATLTCRLTALDYLDEAAAEEVGRYISCPKITYTWENGRFVRP